MIDKILEVEGIQKLVQKEKVKYLLGDNMALLRWMKDQMMYKYFHVGIVDPPYGVGIGDMRLGTSSKAKKREYVMGKWDYEVPTLEYWYLLNYVCRDLIIWGGNYFTDMFGQVTKHDGKLDVIKPGRCFIVWDKKSRDLDFADCELALTTYDKNARIIEKARNLTAEDVNKRHPTQKPVYLYDYLHLNFVERNQRVLDTHGGSFNHAIAAIKNGVDLTIIDQEESYFRSGIGAAQDMLSKPRLMF